MKYLAILLIAALSVTSLMKAQDSSGMAVQSGNEAAVTEASRDIKAGEELFKQRCSACHRIESRLIGPPLKGVTQKQSEEWLIKFIRNSPEFIASGDPDAVKIFNEYNKTPMITNLDLTDDQIRDVLAYIDKPEEVAVAPTGTTGPTGQQLATNEKGPLTTTDYLIWIGIIGVVVSVTLLLYFGMVVKSAMKATLDDKK